MRIRVKFTKTGPIRFVGHLDFMRTFQKIIKRSGLLAVYTGGFNPHMVLSFADPLGVGQESTGEYADIEFAYRDTAELSSEELYRLKDIGINNEELPLPPGAGDFLEALNAVSPEGVHFTDAVRVGLTKSSKAMALVRYAAWDILLSDAFSESLGIPHSLSAPDCDGAGQTVLDGFLSKEQILVRKVTKNKEKEADIRPQILSLTVVPEHEFPDFALSPDYSKRSILRLVCESGSSGNLKPATALLALSSYAGTDLYENGFRLVRRELFDADERPLLDAGTRF